MNNRHLIYTGVSLLFVFNIAKVSAQTVPGDLIDGLATELEVRSGRAALETYNRLIREEGCVDSAVQIPPSFPTDELPVPEDQSENIQSESLQTRACTGRIFDIFKNVREIVHTANDINQTGPIEFSLGSDLRGLGFALRWLAAEEYAAQGDISSDFAGGQISGLSTRLSALRFGAQGFQFAQNGVWQPQLAREADYGDTGGAAGAESNYGRWGGFLNLQYGAGSRDATDLEVAFDMDLISVTFGADYRINKNWTAGVVFGANQQEIDFDGSKSIVEGGIESDGYSVMPFFMFQHKAVYLSGSLGMQTLSFDTLRAIRYPSFNLNTSSTNTETVSSADASVNSFFLEAGYSWYLRKFSVEPYINVTSSDITIDELVEDDVNDDGFDLVIKEQSFDLVDATVGLKMQYTFTPKVGVFIPYLTIEQVNQLNNESRDVEAYYSGLSTDDTIFTVPTEELDDSYNTINIGISAVLRGGREKTAGGSVGGDIQAFANLKTITGLDGYDLNFYTLGFRYTF